MTQISGSDWAQLAGNPAILESIRADGFSLVYPYLVEYFRLPQDISWGASVVGLHVVYGWMPTIPKLNKLVDWDDKLKQQLVTAVNRLRGNDNVQDDDLKDIKRFCNNSMVGASKFLHFLNPNIFPIWDSNVAKVFHQKRNLRREHFNTIESWKNYMDTVNNWQQNDSRVKELCRGMREKIRVLNGCSNLRIIETVMFHANRIPQKK